MGDEELIAKLRAPFSPADIEWRIQQAGMSEKTNKPWAMVIPYITSRAVRRRLTDVFGLNWSSKTKPVQSKKGQGWLCEISVLHNGEWITRCDGSEETDIEAMKGGISGAQKRAGGQFEIGGYLYQMDVQFAECEVVDSRRSATSNYQHMKPGKNDKWEPFHLNWLNPILPDWALPQPDTQKFLSAMESADTMDELEQAFRDACRYVKTSSDDDFQEVATENKDIAKTRITKRLALNMSEELGTITEWLANQISQFGMIHNLSALAILYGSAKEEFERLCKGQVFDVDKMRNELESSYVSNKTRIEDLTNDQSK